MTSALMKLLALVALVLMPLGMGGAPAVAQPAPDGRAVMAMGHCDEQQEREKAPASKKMDCAAACTAIPADAAAEPAAILKPKAPRTIALVAPFTGVVLEIATPPPRQV